MGKTGVEMQLIAEIFRNKNLVKQGRFLRREAVRAVILADHDYLLMIHSKNNGDYKLPGGGVKKGESHLQALKREVTEESGFTVEEIKKELGVIIEYKEARDPDFDIFQMNSYYYLCRIKRDKKEQDLDDYEKMLGLSPVWINFQKVLVENKKILVSEFGNPNSWVERETVFLKWLEKNMF